MEAIVNTQSLTDIKGGWGDVVERAKMGIPTVGTDRGKRVVAVVPVEMLDKYVASEMRELHAMIRGRENEDTTNLNDELESATHKLADLAPDAEKKERRP